MGQRNVRVEIPIKDTDDTETLTDAVIARHTALGGGSPLTGQVDMAMLASKHNTTVTKRAQSRLEQGTSEAEMLEANTAMGTAPGQYIDTAGTVYNLTGLSRDRLLFVSDGKEEELEKWGFNVVISETAGERTVSVDIPIRTNQKMEKLVNAILARHAVLGGASPLTNQVNTGLLASQMALSKSKRTSSQLHHGNAQALMQEAGKAMGTEAGQTIITPATVYHLIGKVRNRLLFVHQGEEEQLSTYGFNVVITEGEKGDVPPTGTFTATPPSVAAGKSSTLAWQIEGSQKQEIDNAIGEVANTGTRAVTPAATAIYTLTATAADESTLTITAPVTVGDAPPPPPQ